MAICTTIVDFGGLFTLVTSAADASALAYKNLGNGTCSVIGFDRNKLADKIGELIIPEQIDGLTVVGIGEKAFKNCTELTRVVIPDTVTSISGEAFSGCEKLSDIVLSKNITSMGSKVFDKTAFYNDETNWDGDILYIGNSLVAIKSTISGEITIKDGTTNIMGAVFSGNTKITKITIPGSISVINSEVFMNCTGLTEVVLSEGVKEIGVRAFSGCSNLAKITIPASIEKIGESAFGSCRKLTEPNFNGTVDQWVNIDFYSFYDSPVYWAKTLYIKGEQLTEAVISSPVVKKSAFTNCQSLEKVTFTDSVVEIQERVFSDNYYLKEVTIGKNLKKIGYNAFQNCSRIEKVSTTQSVNEWSQIDFYNASSNPAVMARSLYINGQLLEEAVFSDITEIKPYTFASCASIKSISLPNTVKTIGEGAFRGTSVEELIIPEGTTTINAGAFASCANLKKVVLPSTLTQIYQDAFSNSTNINCVNYTGTIDQWAIMGFFHEYSNPVYYSKNLYINGELVTEVVLEKAQYISGHAFVNCESIEHLYLPDGFVQVGWDAFSGCVNLKTVDIPNTATTFVSRAFEGCYGLEKVNYRGTVDQWASISFHLEQANPVYYSRCLYLNDVLLENAEIRGTHRIQDYTFLNCDSIKTLVIGGEVKTIGHSFSGCRGLTSIEIQESVTGIGVYAFRGCTALVDVQIAEEGEKLNLSSYAFYECSSLEEIRLPQKITSIGNATFKKCTSLKSVYISKELDSICYDAFYDCPSLEIIYYESSEENFANIKIEYGNEALASAEIHYNVADVDSHYTIVTVPATCTEDGYETKSCPCGYSSFTIIHASSHKHIIANQKDATCTTDGYTGDEICEACKEVFKAGETIEALGHIGGTATCKAPALCERCNQNYGETLPHAYTNDKDAICNECGYERETGVTEGTNQPPNDDTQKPNEDVQIPNENVQTPNNDVQVPNGDGQTPNNDVQTPNGNVQTPNNDIKIPNNNSQTSDIENTTSPNNAQVPSGDNKTQNDDSQAPSNNGQVSNNNPQDSTAEIPSLAVIGVAILGLGALSIAYISKKKK